MSCTYIFNRGKDKGKQCTRKPRGGKNRCWKHPEKVEKVNDLTGDDVFGSPNDAPKAAPAEKLRSSVWTWTIVSNTKFEEYLFNNDAKVFLDFITDQNSPEDSRKNIVRTESDFAFEVAPDTNYLHAHGLLKVYHRGFLRMRVADLHGIAHKQFGKRFHISFPVGHDPLVAWENYMQKHQGVNKVEL